MYCTKCQNETLSHHALVEGLGAVNICNVCNTARASVQCTWTCPHCDTQHDSSIDGWGCRNPVCPGNVGVEYDDVEYDDVARPEHYVAGRKIEPIDAIEDWNLGYHLGQVVKYVSRAGRKASSGYHHDLRKARWYLDRALRGQEVE